MDTLLNDYMKFYELQTADDYRNALKEIVQEIAYSRRHRFYRLWMAMRTCGKWRIRISKPSGR